MVHPLKLKGCRVNFNWAAVIVPQALEAMWSCGPRGPEGARTSSRRSQSRAALTARSRAAFREPG